MTDQQKIKKLTRAAYVILFDRTTRKYLAKNDRMTLIQLEDAVRSSDPSYDEQKERVFQTWNAEDEKYAAIKEKDSVVFTGPEYKRAGGPIIGTRGIVIERNGNYVQPVGEERQELVTVLFDGDTKASVVGLNRISPV